jgi:dihydroorotate dehydrogenase electron transfer subunit
MTPWIEEIGEVVQNLRIDRDVFRLLISAPRVAKLAQAGQFVMIRSGGRDPLLPRAMAPIRFGADDGQLDIYYRVVGPGTHQLSSLRSGAAATIVGPLGRPFEEFAGVLALVGRGVGITPLLPIATAAMAKGRQVRVYLSARTSTLLLNRDQFEILGPVVTQTDADAPGHLVTESLAEHLEQGFRPDLVVVAGSHRLARHTFHLGQQFHFPVKVFVEEKMACGVGFCKGCAIGLHSALICTEGPALPAEEVILDV